MYYSVDSIVSVSGVADGEHGNRILADGEQDAKNATPLAVEALADFDAEAFRFLDG
jgi:hypothetical protein